MKMLQFSLLLCAAAVVSALRLSPSVAVDRRAVLASATGAAITFLPASSNAADALSEQDEIVLQKASKLLEKALANWKSEAESLSIGFPGVLQQLPDMLPDDTIKRLVAFDSDAKELETHRNAMLSFIFLAQGAVKYEPQEVDKILAKAKVEAERTNAALFAVAKAQGMVLETSSSK